MTQISSVPGPAGLPLRPLANIDFRAVFEQCPPLMLLLDPAFIIAAVTNTYAAATNTRREDIVGRHLFEVFPDNPDDTHADGVGNLRASLLRVMKTGRTDEMAIQKYDIKRPLSEGGGFERRYWRPRNSPVLGPDGYITWIVHQVQDVTSLVQVSQPPGQD